MHQANGLPLLLNFARESEIALSFRKRMHLVNPLSKGRNGKATAGLRSEVREWNVSSRSFSLLSSLYSRHERESDGCDL